MGILLAALGIYVVVLAATWRLSRGNSLAVVASAYLIAPAAVDNLLPQVTFYPSSDTNVQAADFFLLADIVLIAALVFLVVERYVSGAKSGAKRAQDALERNTQQQSGWVRWWIIALTLLAAYPTVIGIWAGVGQSTTAVLYGAFMPLRGVLLAAFIAIWAHRHTWTAAVSTLIRMVVFAGTLLALSATAIIVFGGIGGSTTDVVIGGFHFLADGRPAMPGWGNNIMANFICVAIAFAIFGRARLGVPYKWVTAAIALMLIGIAMTGVRTAMVLALTIVGAAVVLATVRHVSSRRTRATAGAAGLAAGLVFLSVSMVALPLLNARFDNIVPSAVGENLPSLWDPGTRATNVAGSERTRIGLLKAATDIWKERPVLGVGWNGWGWEKSHVDEKLTPAIDPHNGFLWLLAEAGIVGFVLLYALPVWGGSRRLSLWWLWSPLVVATALEMVNANLRNPRFATVVWLGATLVLVSARHRSKEELT